MAKISARGATEVARVKCEDNLGRFYLYVMCSDGRILYRPVAARGERSIAFLLRGKLTKPEHITADYLEKVIRHDRFLPVVN